MNLVDYVIADALVRNGANVSLANNMGQAPLHVAISSGK